MYGVVRYTRDGDVNIAKLLTKFRSEKDKIEKIDVFLSFGLSLASVEVRKSAAVYRSLEE